MIQLSGIRKTFRTKETTNIVLDNLSLNIKEGESISIMGKSGSGKTTLLNILGGLCKVDQGTYFYRGVEMDVNNWNQMANFRRNNIGIVTQNFALVDYLTVYENIIFPLKLYRERKSILKKRALEVMQQMEISEKKDYYLDELSRGQQQKVAIARAIIKNPKIILADEPTGALDENTGQAILDIFLSLNNQGKTVVIVTHDMDIAKQCKRKLCLEKGKLI
ncbi:ABC transporter ATP-binding protein [Clostridium sp. AF15-17LB]|nr:ABC transporter ATP-binding protein [Clostridium sp. AF15-17LB]